MRQWILLFVTMAAAGCATGGRPYPMWAEVGLQWGCNPLDVEQMNLEAVRTRSTVVMTGTPPQVGWTACDLLARAGTPREQEVVQLANRRSYHLRYRLSGEEKQHLVVLDEDDVGVWRVSAVVW